MSAQESCQSYQTKENNFIQRGIFTAMRQQLKDMPLSTALLIMVTLLVLAGSVHHVAYTFSTLENGNLVWGYIQALGIDLGLLGLAYGVQLRKRQGRSTLPLWSVLGLLTFISAYANYLYGVMHQQPLPTQTAFDQAVVFLRPFLLSVSLPVIMFALIEIIGEDRNYTLKIMDKTRLISDEDEREARILEPSEIPQSTATSTLRRSSDPWVTENGNSAHALVIAAEPVPAKPASKEHMMEQILISLATRPTISKSQLARDLGCSRQTLYAYLEDLEQRGYIRRSSAGYETVVTPIPEKGASPRENTSFSRERFTR